MARYCVIGAGAASISAPQQLHEARYDVPSKSHRVTAHRHTDYAALHLIPSRDDSSISRPPAR